MWRVAREVGAHVPDSDALRDSRTGEDVRGGRFTWTRDDLARVELEASEWENGLSGGPGRYATVLETWPTDEPKPSPELIRQRGEAALANPSFDRLAQAAIVRGFAGQVVSASKAAAVTVPTLGIGGSADPLLAELRELKRLRPGMRLVVIDGATHSGPRHALRRPEFLAAVREFLHAQPRN